MQTGAASNYHWITRSFHSRLMRMSNVNISTSSAGGYSYILYVHLKALVISIYSHESIAFDSFKYNMPIKQRSFDKKRDP